MSSQRDRRIRIYRAQDAGSGAFPSSKYVFASERWGDVAQVSTHEASVSGGATEHIDAVIDVASYVDVQTGDLVIDGTDRYFVRGVQLQRAPDAKIARCERVSDEDYETLDLTQVATLPDEAITAGYVSSVFEG